MKRRMTICLLAAAALAVCTEAQAQRGQRGGPRRGGNALFLLRNDVVQKDLKLNEKQQSELDDLLSEQSNAFQELRDADPEKRRETARELAAKAKTSLKKILDKKQNKRLHQLQLQQQGAAALAQPKVAKKMKLSDEQTSKIQSIVEQGEGARRKLFESAGQGGNRREAFGKMREMREKQNAEIAGLLTDEQKQQWTKMLGEKLEIPRRQRGGV